MVGKEKGSFSGWGHRLRGKSGYYRMQRSNGIPPVVGTMNCRVQRAPFIDPAGKKNTGNGGWRQKEQESQEKQFLLKKSYWLDESRNYLAEGKDIKDPVVKTLRLTINEWMNKWRNEKKNISEPKSHTGPNFTELNTLPHLKCHNSHQHDTYSLWSRNTHIQGI